MLLAEKGAAAIVPVVIAIACLVTLGLRRTRIEKQHIKSKTARTSPWIRELFKNQWVGIISAVIALGTLYLANFWKPDDLVVYFRFNPQELATSKTILNYIFSNSGKNSVFMEKIDLE
jgi:hypothetical protein